MWHNVSILVSKWIGVKVSFRFVCVFNRFVSILVSKWIGVKEFPTTGGLPFTASFNPSF